MRGVSIGAAVLFAAGTANAQAARGAVAIEGSYEEIVPGDPPTRGAVFGALVGVGYQLDESFAVLFQDELYAGFSRSPAPEGIPGVGPTTSGTIGDSGALLLGFTLLDKPLPFEITAGPAFDLRGRPVVAGLDARVTAAVIQLDERQWLFVTAGFHPSFYRGSANLRWSLGAGIEWR